MIGRKKVPTPEQIAAHYAEQALICAALAYVKDRTDENFVALERSAEHAQACWQEYVEHV